MRGRFFVWLLFLFLLQLNDNAAERAARRQMADDERENYNKRQRESEVGEEDATKAGRQTAYNGHSSYGPRILSLKHLTEVYMNESARLGNLTFHKTDVTALDRFTASLIAAAAAFNSSGRVAKHDPVDVMVKLWTSEGGTMTVVDKEPVLGTDNTTGTEEGKPRNIADLKKIPPLDLPVIQPLVELSRNTTLKRYLAPHVFYRNLSATFTGKWSLVDLEPRLPVISPSLGSNFFTPVGFNLTSERRNGSNSSSRSLARSSATTNLTTNNNYSSSNSTARTATRPVPNPLSVFNTTLAKQRRGTALSTNDTIGTISLTLFGNASITDDLDFVTAHMVLKPGDPPSSDSTKDALFVGYGIHDLPTGAAFLFLVPPGRDLPIEQLLQMLPTESVFSRGRDSAVRFLKQRIDGMAQRMASEGQDATETFAGSSSSAASTPFDRTVPPDCNFQVHLQLDPIGRPFTEADVLEFTEQVHGNKGDGRSLPKLPKPRASVFAYSRECLFAIEARETKGILLPSFFSKLSGLAFALCLVVLFELAGILAQFQRSETLGRLAKASIWTLGSAVLHDALLSAAALVGSMVLPPAWAPLAALAFLKLVSCAVFQGRYILLVLRARRIEVSPEAFRRFYALWVFAMVLFWLLLGTGGWAMRVFVGLTVGGMWWGQVVINIRRNNRGSLHPLYVVANTVGKFFLPIYYLGCPGNVVWPESPGGWPALLVFGYGGLQVALLISQDLWGGRWFLPKELFPPAYDYHPIVRPPDIESGPISPSESPSCAICYTHLEMYPTGQGPVDRSKYMVTPCGHHFCSSCLQTWMEEKMECPVCRQGLPGLSD